MNFSRTIALLSAGIMDGTGITTVASERLTDAQAKAIALEDAGLTADQVTFDRIEMGTEQGASVYEIEFKTGSMEYDYDVAKAGGKILHASRKVKVPACVAAAQKASANTNTGKTGEDAAIEAALNHAGLTANDVTGLHCHKDYDDGREVYEVEFRQGRYEFSYDIDVNNYSVLEWDKDYDD